MNENTGNLKPLQIINPMTGRKIFVGTKTYKDLQNQGMIPKDVAFNTKKLAKAEPMFKVMNKPSGAKPKSAMVETKSATKSKKTKSKAVVESESSSEDDEEDALEKILAKSKSKKTKRPPTPQPSSESESESESEDSSSSDSSD
jgi:hypothetical protein